MALTRLRHPKVPYTKRNVRKGETRKMLWTEIVNVSDPHIPHVMLGIVIITYEMLHKLY